MMLVLEIIYVLTMCCLFECNVKLLLKLAVFSLEVTLMLCIEFVELFKK